MCVDFRIKGGVEVTYTEITSIINDGCHNGPMKKEMVATNLKN